MAALWSVVEIVEDPILTLVEAFSPAATIVTGPTPAGVSIVELVETGPPGPPGPPGPAGSPVTYVHVQSVAASTWVIVHGLANARPLVEVIDSAELLILPSVEYVNSTTVHVYHSSPVAGRAILI